MVDIRRLWRHGRTRGPAQGVVVFGPPGFVADQEALTNVLGRHERLAEWMRTADLDLVVSAAGLGVVDAMINTWRDDPTIASALTNEVGIFLGMVLLHEISDARWHVCPNGHPVVRLASGQEIDVTAQTATRVHQGHPHLDVVLARAAADRRR